MIAFDESSAVSAAAVAAVSVTYLVPPPPIRTGDSAGVVVLPATLAVGVGVAVLRVLMRAIPFALTITSGTAGSAHAGGSFAVRTRGRASNRPVLLNAICCELYYH